MSRLLQVVFAGSRQTGQVDLEAIEMLVRDSMHRAGAAALERLLSMPAPQPGKVSCDCGHTAQYHDKRSKQLLTVLGPVHFHGSGVIEAGCKTVIGSRLKQSGMFWTVRGANAIVALRCICLSRKFEDYCASRSRAA